MKLWAWVRLSSYPATEIAIQLIFKWVAGEKLAKELKKMDDKDLIVEVQLEESKAAFNLRNMTKARWDSCFTINKFSDCLANFWNFSGALTSARTTANGIYVPPKMQAALDMQSGSHGWISWLWSIFLMDLF